MAETPEQPQPETYRGPRPRWPLIAVFLAALVVPAVAFVSPSNPDPAVPPVIRFATLAQYPMEVKRFWQDHFGMRHTLVTTQSRGRLALLHASPTWKVLLGKKGWLFYADDGSLAGYRNVAVMDEATLALWAKKLEIRRRVCEQSGAQFYVLFAPDKHTIYPEYMPAGLHGLHGASRLDQLKAYLAAHAPQIRFIDVRPALKAAKAEGKYRLYQKTDTHWNGYGAWYAYSEIMKVLSEKDPRLAPWPMERFVAKRETRVDRDLAGMMEAGPMYPEELTMLYPPAPAPKETEVDRFTFVTDQPGSNLPRIVVFRDSFFEQLFPLMSVNFSRVCARSILFFDQATIFREHPQFVISELVERALSRPIPADNAPPD